MVPENPGHLSCDCLCGPRGRRESRVCSSRRYDVLWPERRARWRGDAGPRPPTSGSVRARATTPRRSTSASFHQPSAPRTKCSTSPTPIRRPFCMRRCPPHGRDPRPAPVALGGHVSAVLRGQTVRRRARARRRCSSSYFELYIEMLRAVFTRVREEARTGRSALAQSNFVANLGRKPYRSLSGRRHPHLRGARAVAPR